MVSDTQRERPWAITLMRMLSAAQDIFRLETVRQFFRKVRGCGPAWPLTSGTYIIGDPIGPVAICALTDKNLMQKAAVIPGVAICGRVYTANLGIEKIILNVTSNPHVRFLLLCGRDSPLFRPGQTLTALCFNGILPNGRVMASEGYLPVLNKVAAGRVDRFRRQVEIIDCIGNTDLVDLAERVRRLTERNPGPFAESGINDKTVKAAMVDNTPTFREIQPGGKMEPLTYDPKGYFVISLDRSTKQIVLDHYLPDNTPAHQMRSRSGQGILLGLLRENLVSQLSHAGYLGAELAKAEAALRLEFQYEQDKPLSKNN